MTREDLLNAKETTGPRVIKMNPKDGSHPNESAQSRHEKIKKVIIFTLALVGIYFLLKVFVLPRLKVV